MIGIGRRSGPLLVGLTTGALLVGVVTVAQPAPVRPADLISTPASGSTTAPAAPAPALPLLAPATNPATGVPATGTGRAPTGRSAAGGAAAATRAAAAGRPTAPPSPRPSRTSSAGAPAPAKVQAPAAAGGQTAQVVALTNQARTKAGCGALRVDARLTAAAQGHSADMAANDYFSHDSRDGRSFAERIEAQGYPSPGGENIAQGQANAQAVVTAWLNSPGHRANIENCSFTAIGVGLAGADRYWTQDFGR